MANRIVTMADSSATATSSISSAATRKKFTMERPIMAAPHLWQMPSALYRVLSVTGSG
jgi:hypothetical protein